jgi:hypothetical protein
MLKGYCCRSQQEALKAEKEKTPMPCRQRDSKFFREETKRNFSPFNPYFRYPGQTNRIKFRINIGIYSIKIH